MVKSLHYFILPLIGNALILNTPPEYQPGYGYVGPACAVFVSIRRKQFENIFQIFQDSTLFLHGVSKRKLNDHELHIFSSYQHDLSAFKEFVILFSIVLKIKRFTVHHLHLILSKPRFLQFQNSVEGMMILLKWCWILVLFE